MLTTLSRKNYSPKELKTNSNPSHPVNHAPAMQTYPPSQNSSRHGVKFENWKNNQKEDEPCLFHHHGKLESVVGPFQPLYIFHFYYPMAHICACKSRVCVIFRSDGGVHLIRIENVARNNKNYLLSKLLLAYFRIFDQELWWKENIVRGCSSLNLYAACDPLTIETD